jgi:trans-aconitate methyltransferase
MNKEWNAEDYGKNFNFVPQYGRGVIDLIDAPKGSKVIDLGCGNGILTHQLEEQGFDVTGVDMSDSFLKVARTNYPDTHFLKADITALNIPVKADVVFSNAVFHWVDRKDQPKLLQGIHRILKPGGQLVAEFGGAGNNALIHTVLSKVFEKHSRHYVMPFFFPTIGEYATFVESAGLRMVYASLFNRPTLLKGENGMEDWIRMFVRQPFKGIGEIESKEMIAETIDALRDRLYRNGNWYADYVRLRFKALNVADS